MPVARSELITSVVEAREYYATVLAGAHKIQCHGQPVTVVFEREATHLFSTESAGVLVNPVRRQIGGGRVELREFSLARAQQMDLVLRAVSLYTVSVPGSGGRGRENRMLHGPRLPSTEYMRVVLRPGPGDAWTCVSAYCVAAEKWMEMCRAKRAKFPP